tara:strand:+ start:277 stop:576 length:300 start_codon:yes stop_codon:yes gene_type:complete
MKALSGDRSTLIDIKENEKIWRQNDWPGVSIGLKNDNGNLEYYIFFCESSEEWEAILGVLYAIRARTDTNIQDFELLLPDMKWHPESIFNLEPKLEDLQ